MPFPDNVVDMTRWRQRRHHKRGKQEIKGEELLHKYIPSTEHILAVKRLTWLMLLGEIIKAAGGSLLLLLAIFLIPLWVIYFLVLAYFIVRWVSHNFSLVTMVLLGSCALALYSLLRTPTRPALLGSLLIGWVLLWTRYAEKYVTWKQSYYILTDRQLWRIYLEIKGIHPHWRYPSTDLRAASYSDPEITAWYAFLGWVFRVPHVGFFRLGTAVQEDLPIQKFGPTDDVHKFNMLFKEARAALMGNAPPMVPPI
jgi:hypothetical protein